MNSRALSKALAASAVVLFFSVTAGAQSAERIRETRKGPDATSVTGILKKQPASGAARPRPEVLKFDPAGDSGVAKALADALRRSDEERAALVATL